VFHVCRDDIVIAIVTMHAFARSTGVEIVMPMCQLIRFSDEFPIEWRNFAWNTARTNDSLRLGASTGLATLDNPAQIIRVEGGAHAPPLSNFQTGMPSVRALSARLS
jgi:hypothetical protein